MKLSLCQNNIQWANKLENLQATQKKLELLAGTTDLVILPEMFSTGFCIEHTELAETTDGETVRLLKKWAKDFNFAITGSFFATENDKFYNRAFFVTPNGDLLCADKRHTFSLAGEDKIIKRGDKKLIINYLGINICILVCYDIRFPVWARNVGKQYDLLIFAANFPDLRINVWDILLPARAIENQAFVCGVNRVGTDGNGFAHSGHSAIFNCNGTKIAACPDSEDCCITFDLKTADLLKFRQKFAFWKDADRFEIL
ncbi:MAG: nitrilase family protein [Prevotellaceae bacterium]|jgi:predicted amidohydrolase|nr:nitrilase family protein [Prevotellaceae bacterium]